MSGSKAKTIRKQKKLDEFYAPAKSSQVHLRDRRDGSIFNFNTEIYSLQWMKEKWDAGRLHFDCSVQRPPDLMKHFTKNGIARTVIHGGSIHPIIIHHYTVNGEDHWDILNGGHRISFILFELIYDWKNSPKEKFYYTGPDENDYQYEHMSFDEMESSTRKKIEDFGGIVADIFHNLSDEGIGELMIQSNTTEPLNEAARCNAKMSPYRHAIRRITMDHPMCPSPIDGELNQHETFAKIIKNNSKKHLGHFDLMSWLTLPRFYQVYYGLSIYDAGTTNSVSNRESIFGNTIDQGKFKEKHLAQPDKFNELVKLMQKDSELYGTLWTACKKYNAKPKKSKVKGVDKTLFSSTKGSLHDASKMGPLYFLLGLEQERGLNSGNRQIFRLKDAELFLIEFTKAHTKLLEKVKTEAGGYVDSVYSGIQGHWTPGEWFIKNGELYKELMKDKDDICEIGIVFVDSRECFTNSQRKEMYEEQDGICPITKKWYDIADMDADHYPIPRSKGGITEVWNGRMICRKAHQDLNFDYISKKKKNTSDDKSKSRKAA